MGLENESLDYRYNLDLRVILPTLQLVVTLRSLLKSLYDSITEFCIISLSYQLYFTSLIQQRPSKCFLRAVRERMNPGLQ